MEIACCSRWQECTRKRKCVSEIKEVRKQCFYRKRGTWHLLKYEKVKKFFVKKKKKSFIKKRKTNNLT